MRRDGREGSSLSAESADRIVREGLEKLQKHRVHARGSGVGKIWSKRP